MGATVNGNVQLLVVLVAAFRPSLLLVGARLLVRRDGPEADEAYQHLDN